jgi:hypothetical protein
MPQVARLVLARLEREPASLAVLHDRCREVPRGQISACVLTLAKMGILALASGTA